MRAEEFYLRDIVFACRDVVRFVDGLTKQDFNASEIHQCAVLYKLMVVGEAATRVSRSTKSRYQIIDWRSISDFRNIIVHEYFALNLDIVSETATGDAPELASNTAEILTIEYPDFSTANRF